MQEELEKLKIAVAVVDVKQILLNLKNRNLFCLE